MKTPAKPVHQAVVSGVDQHVGLAADSHSTQPLAFGRVELDGHREALCLPQPIAAVLDLGQGAGLRRACRG